MKENKRRSGVLMHVSSLPGRFSIGSFGEEAREFLRILRKSGFTVWQVLPFCSTDECNSPYKSSASFGGNPYFIDLPTLYEEGLLTLSELEEAEQKGRYLCEFDRLREERLPLLRRAAERIGDRSPILALMEEIPELDLAARFMALRAQNGDTPHYEWSTHECDPELLFFYRFLEYEFYTQWIALKEYANSRGISVIGDMPIYVAHDSCEVYSAPEEFLLDPDGFPSRVAGVPPDYFSADGQMWGNPLYNWERMRDDNYSWWRRRLGFALKLFDGVRIDHFRGLDAYWSIPRGAKKATEGRWEQGPGRELIDALKEVAGDRMIIAEDLGEITDSVRDLLKYSGFPGMRVLQFGFLGDGDGHHLPHSYPARSVAYTGTHDNNTLLGYIWELDPALRKNLLTYCGAEDGTWERGCLAAVRTVMASHADTVIFPIQDLLAFGRDTRMNTPGSSEGNWAYRVAMDQLRSLNTDHLYELNRLFGRA